MTAREPEVTVLLSTYNGERHLDAQLESIAMQTIPCHVAVRDDGSSDSTMEALDRWSTSLNLDVVRGSNLGPARSYLELMVSAPSAPYYAFADQDDVWDRDKMEVAVGRLSVGAQAIPSLYFSATRVVDEGLNLLSRSHLHPNDAADFSKVLVRSFASGCTMVFNRALLDLIVSRPNFDAMMHDSWLHKVCLAVGGNVVYDPVPHLDYRQHGSNFVGAEPRALQRLHRWARAPRAVRRKEAAELLIRYRAIMPERNIEVADALAAYSDGLAAKVRMLSDRRFRSGDLGSRASFVVSILLERV